jgi:cytochrome b6-f complex iron-sulfur subunit
MNPDRRLVLRLLGTGAAGVVVLSLLPAAGCAKKGPPPGPATVTIPLAQIPEGKRTVVKVGDWSVELQRNGDKILARSLVCTHQGCVVQWQDDKKRYKCPCQDAWFDADGKPVQGPIDRPLPEFPVSLSADGVTITAGTAKAS